MRALAAALLLLLASLLAGLARPALAQDVQAVPVLTGRVIDPTGTLNTAQRSGLETKLAAFESEAGPQIVVLMIATTQPEDIASYAQRVADQWKLGRREVGDGLLIVVAKNDRKVRIEVAKALEGAVPDLAARQIIQNAITPAFKKGDYAGGLNQGIDQLQARIRGEHLPAPAPSSRATGAKPDSGFDFERLGALFFIGVPVLGAVLTALFGRKLGSVVTGGAAGLIGWVVGGSLIVAGAAAFGALLLVGLLGIGAARRSGGGGGGRGGTVIPPVIWGGGSSSGWSGGGSGSSGSDFSSGGGGDFGGGGASGDW